MNWIIKILYLVLFCLLGWILSLAMPHLAIMLGLLDTQSVTENFGQEMIHKTVMAWVVSVLVGTVSLFIKQKWRYVLTLAPLYAPSLFVLIYALSQ